MLRNVVLHGQAAELYGPLFKLSVKSPAEAVRALCCQLKGFEKFIKTYSWRVVFKGKRKDRDIDEQLLTMYQGEGDFHLIPVITGSGGKGGLGKILLGVILIAVAFIALPVGASMSAAFIGSMTYGNIAGIGVAMLLSGVGQMLAPHPKLNNGSADKKDDSFLFGGQTNTTNQGVCIPVGFGRFTVGSVVISAGINTDQIAIGVDPDFTSDEA